uniref:Uncharacterized protein n=1 Tax=Eutreptiella gymnastica TaxID=73025 RepID=A0A7S4G1F3_9EUGL
MCILVSTVWLTGSVPVCEEQLIRLQRSLHRLPFNITPIVAIKHNAAELKIVVKGIHDCSATVRTNSVISEIQLRQRTVPFQRGCNRFTSFRPESVVAEIQLRQRTVPFQRGCKRFTSVRPESASPPSAPSPVCAAATALPPSA